MIAGSLTHFLKGPVGTSLKNRAARLGDLPAFYDVTVHDLVVDKIGNLFVIEFAQPEGAGDNKEKLTQVPSFFTCCSSHSTYNMWGRRWVGGGGGGRLTI